MARQVIPATGTVKFIAFHLEGERLETRHGGKDGKWIRRNAAVEWRRPCVGLVFEGGSADVLWTDKDGDSLSVTELVVGEYGSVYRAHEYLHDLLGGAHWDHTAFFFEPHVAGPVTDAPPMRLVDEPTPERDAGAYLSGTVAVGAICFCCKAEAEAVLCSDLLGEHDICQSCGELEIQRMRDSSCVCDARRHDGPPCELHAPTRYPQ